MKTKSKGITLIALIITIIVMLILVGVTISILINSNLFGFARTAAERTKNQMARESILNYDFEQYKDEEDREYNITYHLNGGINAEGQATKFKIADVVRIKDPNKEGSVFQGWYESSDFSGGRVTTIKGKRADVDLYARWLEETSGEYFTWTMTETEATITGFSADGLTAYNNNMITSLVIPKTHEGLPVTAIGASAFSGKTKIEELVIGDNVTALGTTTFSGCKGMKKLTIPISLNSVVNGFRKWSICIMYRDRRNTFYKRNRRWGELYFWPNSPMV